MSGPDFALERTPDGWRLPLVGNLISYRYVRSQDFAFEVWLGGDRDVTVRLMRPFVFGRDGDVATFDPRTTAKSQLAPLLGFGTATVQDFRAREDGELMLELSDDSCLVARPAEDGSAWALEWPSEGAVQVLARPRGGLILPEESAPAADVPTGALASGAPRHDKQPAKPAAELLPVRGAGGAVLPIRGPVTEAYFSGVSSEFLVPIAREAAFCIHVGGELSIVGRDAASWIGDGSTADQTTLGPILDLIGGIVTDARIDDHDRLRLVFDDGRLLTAMEGRWEAHWPVMVGSLDEHWVPRSEGPWIP